MLIANISLVRSYEHSKCIRVLFAVKFSQKNVTRVNKCVKCVVIRNHIRVLLVGNIYQDHRI